MRKFIFSLFFACSLAGCSMYHPEVQQGNVATPKQASQLRIGMSRAEVKKIFGDPVLVNTFAGNRLNYVYTYQHKDLPMAERQIVLTFKNGRLINISKKYR